MCLYCTVGVQVTIALQPDVVRGMSGTASKLTGTVSHVPGQATGDSSLQEEWGQIPETCQTSGDHFKVELDLCDNTAL